MHRFSNRSKIEGGTLGLPAPLGEGQMCTVSCWMTMPLLDAMNGDTLQQKTTHKGRENSNNYRNPSREAKHHLGALVGQKDKI